MRDVRPYYVPPTAAVQVSPWERAVDGGWEPLDAYVPDWDYRTRLTVRCTITTDVGTVRRACGLTDGSPLVWSIGWRATDSGLVAHPKHIDLCSDRMEVVLDIPPDRAGAGIALTRRLILTRSRVHAPPGEIRWAGSVLWEDQSAVRLTGSGQAFPTEVVDFKKLRYDERTSWYLQLPASPDVAAMGSLLLLINDADTALVGAVTAGPRPTPAQEALLGTLFEEVTGELVHWALERWSELELCEPDSAGASARIVARRVLADPERWTDHRGSSMDLRSAITAGARSLGFGRRLS